MDELATSDVGLDDPKPINVAVRTNNMAIGSMMALEAYVVGLEANVQCTLWLSEASILLGGEPAYTHSETNHTAQATTRAVHLQTAPYCI